MNDFSSYQSPFSWRYGSPAMRQVWSERRKRLLWRTIWVALAEVQTEYGLVAPEQVADLRAHVEEINIPRALEIEAEIHHDLMAEVRVFAEQATIGGGIIHFGATSMDIEDNADALRLRESLDLTLKNLCDLLLALQRHLLEQADTPLIAFTHIQPAEPSTLGYRLAQYAQDLLDDYETLRNVRSQIRGKGFKGAVGTSASYAELLGAEQAAAFEQKLSEKLDLPFYAVATQTYPRKQDYTILAALAGLAQSLYKLAFDLRLLQSPPIGELAEPFGSKQVGSSAMPFKRNPIRAEKVDSLGRYLAQLPRIAWDNAAHSLLERTLDDSANRRIILPEAFLAADEMLHTMLGIVRGLQINHAALQRNLEIYGPFAATERVLMATVRAGASRQDMHEVIRAHSMQAWQAIRAGEPNPLIQQLAQEPEILKYISAEQVQKQMDYTQHVGNAPQKAREMAQTIERLLGSS
ncbi:MAG: adenylosuccinate lyase [Anaerolineae bacterium]|nr:MAG: adenylosuccinate lyase [Anaerolineae bacterium]